MDVYRAFDGDHDCLYSVLCVFIPGTVAEKAIFLFDLCDNLLFGAADDLCGVVDFIPIQSMGVADAADGVFLPGGFADEMAVAAGYGRAGGEYCRG